MPLRRAALCAAGLALATGCGSTVQTIDAGSTVGANGLTAPAPGAASPGAVVGRRGTPVAGTSADGLGAPVAAGAGTVRTAPGEPGALPSTVPGPAGATSTTGPLKIGMLLTRVSNADDFGVKLGNTYDERDIDNALVTALNKRGGLDGRKIVPIYASTDTGTTNWSTDFQAACATFTQDNHVDAVLGYAFDYERNFESCLAKNAVPHLTTSFNIPDNAELRQWPLFWALETPTIDERSLAKIQGAIATGALTSKSRLGVVLDDCPGTQHAWNTVTLPYLRSRHVNVVSVHDMGCGSGNNASQANAVSTAGNAIIDFRSKNVDSISFFTVSEGPALLVLAEAAESQHYYPKWIVSSLANLALQQGQAPSSQLKNVHGYGWLESQDVSPSLYSKPNPTQRRCLSLLESERVRPSSAADYGFAYSVCESMFVYERALQLSHGNSVGAAVIEAVARIGSFQSVLNYAGASRFGYAIRNQAPRVYRHVVWQDNCACFQYVGPTYPMP